MSRTLSVPAAASLFAQETEQVWLALLTIAHPNLAVPIRLVNNNENVTSGGFLFTAFPFEIQLPGQDEDGIGEARLVVDNADRSVLLALRELLGPLSVTIAVVLAATPNVVEILIPDMALREVDWDAERLSAVLRMEDLLSEPLSLQMTPARFPGLG